MRPLQWLCLPALCLLLCGCEAELVGLEVEVIADVRDAGRLSSLQFEILDIQVQPSGFEVTADHQVTPEWVRLDLLVDFFDVHSVRSAPLTIARAEIPVGQYDRIFLRPESLRGQTPEGHEVIIENVMEPAAIPFEIIEGRGHVLRLELIVLESLDGESRLSIFAKNVEELN